MFLFYLVICSSVLHSNQLIVDSFSGLLLHPLVDPDRLDTGVGRHGVDQRHVLAVRSELPGLNTVQGPISRVGL